MADRILDQAVPILRLDLEKQRGESGMNHADETVLAKHRPPSLLVLDPNDLFRDASVDVQRVPVIENVVVADPSPRPAADPIA